MTRPTILDRDDVAVVPTEPTGSMIKAALDACPVAPPGMHGKEADYFCTSGEYVAMLSASPLSSAWQEVREYVAGLERHVEELKAKIDPDTDCACSYDEAGTVCTAHSPRVRELERQLASCETDRIERIEQCNRMANDWSEFCVSVGVIWDTQEAVASEVKARSAALELRLAEAERVIATQADALSPLSNAVFNDNGDMTISSPFVTSEHCVSAYFADRAARAWREGK